MIEVCYLCGGEAQYIAISGGWYECIDCIVEGEEHERRSK